MYTITIKLNTLSLPDVLYDYPDTVDISKVFTFLKKQIDIEIKWEKMYIIILDGNTHQYRLFSLAKIDLINHIFYQANTTCWIAQNRAIENFHHKVQEDKNQSSIRVLSFCGGGIRGLISILLLNEIGKHFVSLGKFYLAEEILDYFDVYAGTSTGSIIALLLATHHSFQQIIDLYISVSKQLFERPTWYQISTLWGVRGAKYPFDNLYQACNDLFRVSEHNQSYFPRKKIGEEIYLGDLNKFVYIPTLKLNSHAKNKTFQNSFPVYLSNLPPTSDKSSYSAQSLAVKCKDAMGRSTAAPTYFPAYQGYADGGMFANNPTGNVVIRLLDIREFSSYQQPKKIEVLNIGTGDMAVYLDNECDENIDIDDYSTRKKKQIPEGKFYANYGLDDYLKNIFDLLVGSVANNTVEEMKKTLGKKYYYLNPHIEENIELDDITAIPKLRDVVDTFIKMDPRWNDCLVWAEEIVKN